MRANYLIARAYSVTDSTGQRKAVQLEWDTWEELLEFLEDIADSETIGRTHKSGEELVPLEQAKAELGQDDKRLRPFGLCAGEFTVPDDFDDPLPEHVLEDFEGRR